MATALYLTTALILAMFVVPFAYMTIETIRSRKAVRS
jgi:hypothetical protein